ncbi:MAG: hypothetical protein P8188_13505 [Gemmatimonadota bacterium]
MSSHLLAHAARARGSSHGTPHRPSTATARKGSRTALCLWLPTFELRLELVRSPELDRTSVALLSPDESARRTVWQVSERAFEAGAAWASRWEDMEGGSLGSGAE